MDTLHLSPPSFLLCTRSFTFTRTSWLSYTSWLLISSPPLSPSLSHRGVQPLPHPLHPRLAVVFEWCSADGKRWAMTDGYDKQMVLLVIFNHTNSVSRDAGASSCQTAQSRDKFIQRTIEFDTENLLGEKRLHQNDVLARWGERWYKSAERTISFSNQKG